MRVWPRRAREPREGWSRSWRWPAGRARPASEQLGDGSFSWQTYETTGTKLGISAIPLTALTRQQSSWAREARHEPSARSRWRRCSGSGRTLHRAHGLRQFSRHGDALASAAEPEHAVGQRAWPRLEPGCGVCSGIVADPNCGGDAGGMAAGSRPAHDRGARGVIAHDGREQGPRDLGLTDLHRG